MIEFGKTLREAREAKGYSASQLAEMTHILPQIIENLEREDFSKIVAPIYGRGFVKLYCEQVGLDPKPLIAEFMEIFNGNRPPVVRMMNAPSKPEPAEEVQAQDDAGIVEEPTAPIAEEPIPEPPVHDNPFTAGPDDLPFPSEPQPRRDYRPPRYSMPDVPRSFWRFGILVVAAIALLTLAYFSFRTLYRATMIAPQEESSENIETEQPKPPSEKRATSRAPRQGVEIPPLYID